jgi:copper resistance protein C
MRIRLIALVVTALSIGVPAAHAHARLDHASPIVGSTVKTAPKEVTLSFSEALEPKFSSIEVRDAHGGAMQIGAVQGVAGNRAQLRVALKPLPPGSYTVKWKALSVDTHRTQGDFTFTVEP